MRKTRFAGLTQLEPGESLALDNASFQARNPDTIDRYLEIGALTHRHDDHPALASPTAEASGTVVEVGGAIPADYSIGIGYGLIDSYGGETTVADGLVLSTPLPYDPPFDEITAGIDYGGGQLLIGTYYYAITLVDGLGDETPMGPHVAVERAPGFASAQVNLSGLTTDFAANDAAGWRLYRAMGGQEFCLLATGDSDTFTDDGTIPVDCDTHPPEDSSNTTRGSNKLLVVVPSGSAGVASGAASFNLYGTLDGSFADAFIVGNFPLSSAGNVIEIADLDFAAQAPPDVSTCIAGAHKIDPDVELLDWHWKRPVAARTALPSGELGDVRLETGTGVIWGMLKAPSGAAYTDWTALGSAAESGAPDLPVVASGRATATTQSGSALIGWEEYVIGERRTWALPGQPSQKPVALLASGGWRRVWCDDFADGNVNDGSYTTDGNGNLATEYTFGGGEVFRNKTGQGRFVRALAARNAKARVKIHPNGGRVSANFTALAINRLFAFDYLAVQYDDNSGKGRVSLNDNNGAGVVASGLVDYPATDVPIWLEIERVGTQVVVRHYASDPDQGAAASLTIPYGLSASRAAHFDALEAGDSVSGGGFLRMQPNLGGGQLDLGYDDLTFWTWDGPDLRAEVASADSSVISREILTSAATSDLYPTFISERGASGVAGSAQVTEFTGSGGARVNVSRAVDGHQVVKITATPGAQGAAGADGATGAKGDTGATGATGAAGPAGSVSVAGSADVPRVPNVVDIRFAGSGGTGVAVQDQGGGSAQVLISGPSGADDNLYLNKGHSAFGSADTIYWDKDKAGGVASGYIHADDGGPGGNSSAAISIDHVIQTPSGDCSHSWQLWERGFLTGQLILLTRRLGAAKRVLGVNLNLEGGSGSVTKTIYDSLGDSDFTLANPGDLKTTAAPASAGAEPWGWLLCDGRAVSRTTYADLFTAITTIYGAGDGKTTFNLPDYRGRSLLGAGQGTGLTSRVVGTQGGEETHLLTGAESGIAKHNHGPGTLKGPSPQTGTEVGLGDPYKRGSPAGSGSGPIALDSSGATGDAGNTNATSAHNNMQPWAAANILIKT